MVKSVSLLSVLVLACLPCRAAPCIRMADESWDFGKAYVGATMQHAFAIENAGDAMLHIGMVRAECGGCSRSCVTESAIAPGKTGRVVLSVTLPDRPGDYKGAVVVHSDDPEQPFKRLLVRGKVLPYKEAPHLKTTVRWPEGTRGEGGDRARANLALENTGARPLVVSAWTCSPDVFIAEPARLGAQARLAPGESLKLSCHIVPQGGAHDTQAGYVAIVTNDPGHPLTVVSLRRPGKGDAP